MKLVFCLVATSLVVTAQAAHWKYISAASTLEQPGVQTPMTATSNEIYVGLTVPSAVAIYGVAPYSYTFFGEDDAYTLNVSNLQGNSISEIGVFGTMVGRHTQTFQWVSDSPSDVPPSAGKQLPVQGYEADYSTSNIIIQGFTGPVTSGAIGDRILDNFNDTSTSNLQLSTGWVSFNYGGSLVFPGAPSGSTTQDSNHRLYNVQAVVFGSATISVDSKGRVLATIADNESTAANFTLDDQTFHSTGLSDKSNTEIISVRAPAEIGNLPVK